jgi:large subunit ribosomal protein L37Ae
LPRTKKVGPAGRYGPRYGTKVRKLIVEVERKLRQDYKCPSCGALKVHRVGSSIWQCRRCGVKFAGAAYTPATISIGEGKTPTAEERGSVGEKA